MLKNEYKLRAGVYKVKTFRTTQQKYFIAKWLFRQTLPRIVISRNAWDDDYRRRGRLWGGRAKNLPVLDAGSKVLELGCGDGKTLAAMPDDWIVTAVDISPEALCLGRNITASAELILASACLLPFQNESFDAVFAFHVTGHLLALDRQALAREAVRVLRKGGKLFFREFGKEDMRAGQGQELEHDTFRRGSGIFTHYFDESEVKGLFNDLKPTTVGTHRWKLRIKGQGLVRAEVEAVFLKS
jgi:SAM-dependent methyltransferase